MLVAIRKRSWEEHVTHPSGLQYSYDDLDLVCCHGVDSEGTWTASGASQQGRRTRCASMPEGCHQMSTDDKVQMLKMTASVVHDGIEPGHIKLVETDVAHHLQGDTIDGSHMLVNVDCLQTEKIKHSDDFHCDSNSGIHGANTSHATDSISHSEKAVIGEVGAESDGENVCKCPYISSEEQQCISISSNNGLSLPESGGEQSGNPPNQQETKETHTEGYSRPPEISETLKRIAVGELEPQTDILYVDKENNSTSCYAGADLPDVVLHSSVNTMDSCAVLSHTDRNDEPGRILVDGEDKGVTESWRTDSADKLDGLNDPERLNENTGLKHHSRDIQEGEHNDHDCTTTLDQVQGSEISYQISLEQHNVQMTVMDKPEGQESEKTESKSTREIASQLMAGSDICVKGESCSLPVNNNASFEQLHSGSPKDPTLTNTTQCADHSLLTSISQSVENTDECTAPNEATVCEDQTVPHHLENSCSTLDPIPEASLVETDIAGVSEPQKNAASNLNHNTKIQDSTADEVQEISEKHTQILALLSVEVNNEVSPEGCHGNQASGCHADSPASEVADGQREHRSPGAAFSSMEETDGPAQTVVNNDAHLASPVLDEVREPGNQKDDSMVKVRMRKRGHGRLDSMVLLLMKLDQLDQEIENALSATSSMGSTPTLQRRQFLELDVGSGSIPTAPQISPHSHDIPAAGAFEPSIALGAKPKNGSSMAVEDVSSHRGGRRLLTPDHLPLNGTVGNNMSVTFSAERSHQQYH